MTNNFTQDFMKITLIQWRNQNFVSGGRTKELAGEHLYRLQKCIMLMNVPNTKISNLKIINYFFRI